MSGTASIRVLHALCIGGQRFEVGTVVETGAVDAALVVATKRAEYVSPEDRQKAVDASREEDVRISRLTQRRKGWVHDY